MPLGQNQGSGLGGEGGGGQPPAFQQTPARTPRPWQARPGTLVTGTPWITSGAIHSIVPTMECFALAVWTMSCTVLEDPKSARRICARRMCGGAGHEPSCYRAPEKCTPPLCISYANVRNHYGPYAYCSLDKGVACVQHTQLLAHTLIKITYTIITVPTPTVAWTRAWLIQGEGGYLGLAFPTPPPGRGLPGPALFFPYVSCRFQTSNPRPPPTKRPPCNKSKTVTASTFTEAH